MSELNPYEAPSTVEYADDPSSVVIGPELRRVGRALGFINAGFNAFILSMLGGPLLAVIGGVAESGALSVAGGLVMVLGVLGSAAAVLIGQLVCVAVPSETGAKGTAVVSAGLQLFSLGTGFVLLAFSIIYRVNPGAGTGLPSIVGEFAPAFVFIVSFFSMFAFVLFLKRLNLHLEEALLADSASSVARLMMILTGGYVLLMVFSRTFRTGYGPQGPSAFEWMFPVGVLILFVLGLATFGKFTTVVQGTARRIKRN